MSYQSMFTGQEIDAAVKEAKALIGKSVAYCSTAKTGQILRVLEVDENGKPTKWEAVDMPSGDSGGSGGTVSFEELTEEQKEQLKGVGVSAIVYDGPPNPREIYVDYYATNLSQGVSYKVTVDVMGRLELLSGGATGKMSISLVPRDANNAVIGSPVQGPSILPDLSGWKTLEWTVTIPSSAVKPMFRVGFYNAFGTAYVDNLKITQLTPTVADVQLIDPGFEAALEPNQKTGGWTFDDWNINFVSRSGEAASDGAYSAKLQYGLTTQWKIIYTDGSEHPITAPMFSSGANGEGGPAPHIGANGNWYLGEVDTGVKALGEDGIGIKDIQKRTVNGQDVLYITLTDDTEKDFLLPSGKDGKDGSNGKDGQNGENGADGVGIAAITQTTASTEDGGTNVFTVTLTNGQSAAFSVKNGSKGSPGSDATVTVDSAISSTSTNPVQNQVIYTELGKKADSSHNQAASTITSGTFDAARIPSLAASKISAGTFAGQVVAGSSYQAVGTSLLRNSKLVSSESYPSNNGEINWLYE